jgi:hypothetical protein
VSGISGTSDSTWDEFDKKDDGQAQTGKAAARPGAAAQRPSSTNVGRVSPGTPRPVAPAKPAPASGSKDDDDFQIERF